VQITDVPWEKVLDVICRTYGYAYEREGNIIRVTTREKQGQENLVTEVFTLNYAKAQDVVTAVQEMKSERGKIKFDDRSNVIIVTDIPTNIYTISKVISRLDTITPQVTIEAKIIELNNEDAQDIGVKWGLEASVNGAVRPTTFPWEHNETGKKGAAYLPRGRPAAEFPAGTGAAFPLAEAASFSYGLIDASKLSMMLQAVETTGKTKILSNPRITTLDNQPARIHVGTEWPIADYAYNEQTDRFVISGWEYKKYGVLLEVTPTINKDGYVTLKVKPEVSDKVQEIDFQGALVPVLSTQTAEATVMIKDGQTLVIGGLLKDKKVTTKTKVPFLGDIPLLGLLFTHKSEEMQKNDLLIFITPRIVTAEPVKKQVSVVDAEAGKDVAIDKFATSPEIEALINAQKTEKATPAAAPAVKDTGAKAATAPASSTATAPAGAPPAPTKTEPTPDKKSPAVRK